MDPRLGEVQSLAKVAARFTVTLWTVKEDESERPRCFGSGVLVKSGERYGILSADHVVRELNHGCELLGLGSPGTERLHAFKVPRRSFHIERFGVATDTIEGPDIGLIILSEHDARRLEAADGYVFYDLRRRAGEFKDDPPFSEGLEGALILGIIEEHSRSFEEDGSRRKVMQGVLGWEAEAFDRRAADADGFDYFSLLVEPDQGCELPNRLNGWSGCGTWCFKQKKGESEPFEWFLCGMVFFAFEREIDDKRAVRCHGYKSIYGRALAALENAS